MLLEKVIWTTLPNHLGSEEQLRVSVHVGPRIVNVDGSANPSKLGDTLAFVDWPARLKKLSFQLEFDNGVSARAALAPAADSELWRRLFPKETPLEPFLFEDHAARDLHVFPVREIHRFLQQSYAAVAAAGIDPPSLDGEPGPLSRFKPFEWITTRAPDASSFWSELHKAQERSGPSTGNGRVVRDDIADPSLSTEERAAQNAFFNAYRFYHRPGSQRADLPANYIEPNPTIPVLDFHHRASVLADHPQLLRRLGLVLDLVADLRDPHGSLPATGLVRVVPRGALPDTPPATPWTRYELDGQWFGARPRGGTRIRRGLLNLNPDLWELFQVDVDGAALQVTGFADTLRRLRDPDRRNHATPSEATVPALRSAGLSLARVNRGELLLEDLLSHRNKNAGLEAGQLTELDAEDLVRGYRIDVHADSARDGARWFSLHRRVAKHSALTMDGSAPPLELSVVDEGYSKATAASSERTDHPKPSDDLYLHEAVFGWDGWSLSVPRPGKRIVEPGEGDAGSTLARHDPTVDGSSLVSELTVEARTLPRLRFGHRYRLRARTVDLAGNSIPFSDDELEPGDPNSSSQRQAYRRFEPVPSPTILRRHRDTEGESLEHLVIRSDLGSSAAVYAISPSVRAAQAAARSPQPYMADSQRHLAPPTGSEQLAEQHGLLDSAFGGTKAAMNAGLRVALREEGTFLDPLIVDMSTGKKSVPQTTIELVPPGTPFPRRRGDALSSGAHAVHPDANVVLPYLPDPLAIGVALTGYDYWDNELFHQVATFSGAWPELEPFRLQLSEGPLGVGFAGGVLHVHLPQAEVLYVRLSSVFPASALEQLGIWSWLPGPARANLKTAALAGRHWMLTPFRWLTLTHAVQRPLAAPDTSHVSSTRQLGSTYADFQGAIINHAKSTGRIDVRAAWTEDLDLLTDDAPRLRSRGTAAEHETHAFGFNLEPIEDSANVARTGRVPRHDFGDTKYRRVTYHSVATTRFREFLPRSIGDDETQIQYVEVTLSPDGKVKPALVHDILSTARPAAPEVAYVVPTFRWERQEGPTRRHVRRGGALRVWLRRPWLSSGDGEQLAVVLHPLVQLPAGWDRMLATDSSLVSLHTVTPTALGTTQEEIETMLVPYVSAWGTDPAWRSALPKGRPRASDFPRAVGSASDLSLAELPASVRVAAAVHDVLYDDQRHLWYCDIELDAGSSYFPFVRLALARYQPHSVPGTHLSRVKMTDFIQVVPTRTAEVTLDAGQLHVSVKGYAGRNHVADLPTEPLLGSAQQISAPPQLDTIRVDGVGRARPSPTPNTILRATLQSRQPGVPGDLGWSAVSAEITLQPVANGFHVVWSAALPAPPPSAPGPHRLLITESETFLRTDLIQGDPGFSTPSTHLLRERVVYADVFEL